MVTFVNSHTDRLVEMSDAFAGPVLRFIAVRIGIVE